MTFEEFNGTLSLPTPPPHLPAYLKVLWFDAKNNWEKAHEIAQDISDKNGSWLHAYLHRKEGDQFNAGYWYRKAGKAMPSCTLEQEWKEIVMGLL